MGYWSAIAQLAGTAMQAYGQYQAGSTASAVGGYNADIARTNAEAERQAAEMEALQYEYGAQIAEMDLPLLEAATAFRQRQSALIAARTRGQNIATIGASGVRMEGSPLEFLVNNAEQAEMEQRLIGYQGALAQLAKRREASQLRYQALVRRVTGQRAVVAGEQQAGLQEYQGAAAQRGSIYAGLGTLASGVGKYYSRPSPGQAPGASPWDSVWGQQ